MKLIKNVNRKDIEQNHLQVGHTLYTPATGTVLDTIRQRNQAGKATFLLASQPVFAESAQVAYLLCEYINVIRNNDAKAIYKSFLCNSRIEALHGAIKISRHNALIAYPKSDRDVLIYDQEGFYADLFDPLSLGPDKALVPGVFFYSAWPDLLSHLDKGNAQDKAAVVVCLHNGFPVAALNRIQTLCKQKQIILIINVAHVPEGVAESTLAALVHTPDIVVWGEALTYHQVPFGAFSVIDDLYRPWATVATCFIHSSTYGGNSLATSLVRDRILENLSVTPEMTCRLESIADDPQARMAAFCTYINPITPLICQAAKLDLDIVSAKGSRIRIKQFAQETISLIDCIGGAGSNLRGYNPDDIGSVLEAHQPATDYWQDLARMLSSLTGLGHVLPAVSGACAVDIAITLAMLANSEKSRILIFKGNYAGKSLISINGTEEKFDREPFAPLYWDVAYLDIFSAQAESALMQELQSGTIALVWFEVMQGNSLNQVPSRLIDLVFANKKEQGYLVGIDEILNGMFRTGPFVSYKRSRYEPDIVTLSKGLSDLTFPISAALVNDDVYYRAKLVNEALVTRFEALFLNQLGAHIALNGLTNALRSEERVSYAGSLLKSKLCAVAEQSPLLQGIRGEGLHLHLMLDMQKFPLSLFGKDVSELLVSRLCLSQGHVLQYFCRLLPPLNISDDEINELAGGIENALKISSFSLFIFGLKHIAVFLFLLLRTQLKSAMARLVGRLVWFKA
ncbi:MAG: hypothetical protein CTY34_07505 [Methylobacter sp.]|nr:MAG: hypothetical protein CTY34_07505 [Methylobacter sp.]PPD36107.1 MAG: hypothetical protein CTY18_05470 [Methylomonas sp.]